MGNETLGVILAGPDKMAARSQVLPRSDIVVGRRDLRNDSSKPDFDLNPDPRVSRRHTRLWQANEKWYIQDLTSKRGTFVGDRPIPKAEPVEWVPGSPVVTGETTWTVVPRDWLFVRSGDVIVCGSFAETVSHATCHCGIPLVGPLTARNIGAHPSCLWRLRFHLERYSNPWFVDVPEILPGAVQSLTTSPVHLHLDQLESRSVPESAELSVYIGAKRSNAASREVTILPTWAWPYSARYRTTLAGFVLPDHPIVQRIVDQACVETRNETGLPSFRALVQSGHRKSEQRVLQALYRYLKDDCILHWCPPKGRPSHQNIRAPDRIVARTSPKLQGEATCVDLALLMAACLESTGLWPVLVLTGTEQNVPSHAFAGCWTGALPGGRPVIRNKDYLCREVEAGNLLLLECTAFARHPGMPGPDLDFDAAMRAACEQLTGEPWVCAVDIGSLRHPYGSITPIDSSLDPLVRRVYQEAQEFARRKQRRFVETTFVLYGCLAVQGQVALWLCDEIGRSPAEFCEQLSQLIPPGTHGGRLSQTHNCRQCQTAAREAARGMGLASVQEHHLLFALLTQGRYSAKFSHVCERLDIDVDRLATILARRYLPPGTSDVGSLGQSILDS